MTPDKLAQLRRQRELVKQHLDWLDAELAAHPVQQEGTSAPVAPPPEMAPQSLPDSTESMDPAFQPDPQSAGTDARRGCLILFFAILALLTLVLCGIYFWKYRDRPLLFPDQDAAASSHRLISG